MKEVRYNIPAQAKTPFFNDFVRPATVEREDVSKVRCAVGSFQKSQCSNKLLIHGIVTKPRLADLNPIFFCAVWAFVQGNPKRRCKEFRLRADNLPRVRSDHGEELRSIDWFRCVIIATGVDALVSITAHRVSRQRQNGAFVASLS